MTRTIKPGPTSPSPRSTTSSRRWSIRGALAIIAVALVAQVASAQPSGASEFQKLVETGSKQFRAGAYAEARDAWQKAFNLNPDPTLLFNIGSTFRREAQSLHGQRRIDKLEEALSYYQRYLEVAPANAPQRGVASEAVLNVQTQIDNEKMKLQPTEPTGPGQDTGGDNSGKILKWSGIGLGVIGLASLSFGIFQGLEAKDLNDKFESLPDGTEWTQELQDDFDRGQSLETQAIAFSIAGGVAVAIGASLYIAGVFATNGSERNTGDGSAGGVEPMSFTPVVGPNQAGFALSGRF